ncbi:MAG: right-handed parallel beta-helix repeat-containing protein [Ignavibacteria bacterium]|nr:right-handed parallel beta-helix repeat-containing protein [Ignavibacteria bacterium]
MLNHDILFPSNPIDSSIGYGRYLVQFWRFELDDSDNFELILRDSLSIDFSDSDYPYSNVFTGFQNDFIVRYYAVDSIIVDFADTYLMKLDTTDRSFEIWNQYASNHIKPQNKIGFSSNQEFCSYPLDARDYGAFDHVGPGLNSLSIEIKNNAFLSNIVSYPTRMSILGGTTLMVDSNKTLDITESVSSNDTSYFELNLSSDSRLMLNAYSQIIVRNNSRLTMNHNSLLYLDTNAAISVMAGGLLCNYGASIRGSGKIVYKGGVHQLMCATVADFLLQDSSKFVLDSSAVLSIPNSTTLHLKGNETALILNPGSKLLFGENSDIVCDSGARIVANDATFASVDSTKKWNGISLNDLASDTIKNCIIKNAMYGIMISERYIPDESSESYSAEISGCSFVNQTSYVLNNAIYLQNSTHVLLKDNTIASNNLSIGFTHGIYAEYCPGEMLNIINNNISNCNNGMTVIQSSPYIAFNTLDGNSNGESGMFLDNSNGTIKYNVISDFYNSYYSFYSSPDLLKNTFDNSCEDNIYLSSSSVPVMHPLQSGGSVYWYAGDNHITGSPYDAGILFDADAYPDMNYGYNRITLTGSNYYLNGVNPSASGREFYVYENYWGQTPPDSLMFNITGADVKFNPYDDNSQSARHTNTFDKTDIGFGLMDTVHILESDNRKLSTRVVSSCISKRVQPRV